MRRVVLRSTSSRGGFVLSISRGGQMRLIIISCLAVTALALAVLAGSAAGSGPAAPGKNIFEITCGGDTFTIAVPRGEDAFGAAQIVGQTGQGIPVSLTFSLVDLTTETLLDSGTTEVGQGHAHPNQTTTSCTIVLFEGTAADFFGPELPPGVAAADIVQFSLAVEVILKL
jgi:hypothetical protein